MAIKTVRDLMEALRQGSYSSVGSYPLFFITADGGALLPSTVRAELGQIASAVRDSGDRQWRVIGHDVNWEDVELYDDHTNERIPSAYGED